MRWYVRKLVAGIVTIAGLLMAYAGANLLGTAYAAPTSGYGIFLLPIGLLIALFGLAFLLSKHQVQYDIPEERPFTQSRSEERIARDRKESGVVVPMTVPLNNEFFRAPPGDGLPAKPLEWWK